MSQFEELLAQLSAEQDEQSMMAKSLPAAEGEDDEAIQTAAEGDELSDLDLEEDEDLLEEDEDEDEDLEMLTKSMTIDGEEVEIIDAEQLIKSVRVLGGRVNQQEEALTKALASTVHLVKSQGTMIKSLTERLDRVSKQGAGRKTVLSVHDKPNAIEPLAKSEGFSHGELLAKAQSAYGAGKITGHDLTVIDVSLRQGEKIENGLLMKIADQ